MGKKYLTTGDIARICDVTPNGVIKWINSGKLNAFRTPGGQRRVKEEDFKDFLVEFNFPGQLRWTRKASESRSILIVDDDQDLVNLLKKTFAKIPDLEVFTASNGYDACIRAGTLKPELVILDIMMPYVDGYEVYRALKANPETKDCEIFIVTALSRSVVTERLGEDVAAHVFEKPLHLAEFRNAIQNRLGLVV